MSDPGETSRAFLLRSVDYGESDRIVTLLTHKRGKISALARGARRSQRRFGGALEPFALLEVTIESRARGLWKLAEANLLASHAGLAEDLIRMGGAAFILELVREVTPEHEPDQRIFGLVEEVLPLLSKAEPPAVVSVVIAAELKVLALAGMSVSIDHCNACGRLVPSQKKVKFHPARGGVVCTPCGGGPIELSYRAQSVLVKLEKLPLAKSIEVTLLSEEAAEIEEALAGFVDYHVECQMRAKTFFTMAKTSLD